ncbi:unnamed protein product [Blepharisma stoltei]|uniref:DUF2867 domain-containing protein n=1 Tax=Blepharisma stoltei TaxID=1481888 RepID=A0AAU9JCE1_9CILI|nr:unnamed protein product [Blepharisma stoltei]
MSLPNTDQKNIDQVAQFNADMAQLAFLNSISQEYQPLNFTGGLMSNCAAACLIRGHQDQIEILKMISEQSKSNMKKLDWVTSELALLKSAQKNCTVIISDDESISSDFLLDKLCNGTSSWEYSLKLLSHIPYPVFKEKSFHILAQVTDMEGNKVKLSTPVHFKILLFTNENPPRLMEKTANGDKIMRGMVEVEADEVVNYQKVVIKEVTSHYRQGRFFMAIVPMHADYIKPLIIEDLVVKARKVGVDTQPRKKRQVKESP